VRRLDILGAMRPSYEGVLTEDALSFVGELNDRFAPPRLALLQARADRRKVLAAGDMLGFLPHTREIREGVLDGRGGAPRPSEEVGGDYRPHGSQDDHQRAQLGRNGIHG
jgi:malate synthase